MSEENKKASEEAAENVPSSQEKTTNKVEELVEKAQEATEAAAEKVEEAVEAVVEKAEEVAEKVEEVVSESTPVAETVTEKVEEVTKATEEKVEEVAEKAEPELVATTAKEPRPIVLPKDIEPILDFDWKSLGGVDELYSEDEKTAMENQYNDTLTSIAEHEVVSGTVVSKTKKEVVINIGYKSEGVVQTSEFRYNPDLTEGDTVEVYVDNPEDKTGQLILSHRKARMLKAWDNVNSALEHNEIVKGYVKCRTKGGLIVDVFGIEAFLPGSQIDVKPIRDYDIYVDKTMDFRVVKINKEFKNVVVSHKALIEAEIEEQKVEIMSKLEKGQVLEGTVKNITSYGVFIDLGGVDGLIHITDLSWGRINHPEEVVELDQKVQVVILDFDDQKKRIALGMKQLTSHPWESLSTELKVGDTVKGKVVVLADYGAFVEIEPGVEGLIHVSEMSWSQHLRTAQDFFKIGDDVEAVIMTLDREERKMSLSNRRLAPDPWEDIESRFPVESKHDGKVTNLSNFGVFVELAEGIDGLIHISDLSWSKKINHPKEFTKEGEQIEVVVLEIDKENRRLSLGHKQLEENPWDVFETVFSEGSVHQGTVLSMTDKGGVVGMPYGVEAFVPGKHMVKEDGQKLKGEETADFIVLEFNKDARKIIVSHARIHEAAARAEKGEQVKAKKVQGEKTRKAVKNLSSNLEKTTLGDLGALSALKDSMEKDEKKPK